MRSYNEIEKQRSKTQEQLSQAFKKSQILLLAYRLQTLEWVLEIDKQEEL